MFYPTRVYISETRIIRKNNKGGIETARMKYLGPLLEVTSRKRSQNKEISSLQIIKMAI
jgi:hypothetical protein